MNIKEKTRFDTRISKDQKSFFEQAASIGGYRSLTDFILMSAQEKAKNIIDDHQIILKSTIDSKIFFDAILAPPLSNKSLINASTDYKNLFL